MELPGFKIPMWERDSSGEMLPGSAYPRISVATYATHDHAPMAVQWEEWRAGLVRGGAEGEGCRRILSELLRFAGLGEADPDSPFEGNVHEALLRALLATDSWIAVAMVTDLFGTTQRFNVPGAVGSENWTARIAEPVSEWNGIHAGLLARWRDAVKATGRF
jgi:4-alpha-glucanotransferase